MEHSGLGSVMWVFGTRSSHFLYRKPRPAVAPHGQSRARHGRLFDEAQKRRRDAWLRG